MPEGDAVQSDQAAPCLGPSAGLRVPAGSSSVLLVEDSRHVAEALRLAARWLGVYLRRVETLAAARRYLARFAPGLVIVDLGLPDGDGLALVAELAQGPVPRRVVALSGDPVRAAEALAAGAQTFLTKPLHLPADLAGLVGLAPGDAGEGGLAPSAPTKGKAGRDDPISQSLPGCQGGLTSAASAGDRVARRSAQQGFPEPLLAEHSQSARRPRAWGVPDHLALRDDWLWARTALAEGRLDYASRFVEGVARMAGDMALFRLAVRARQEGDAAALATALAERAHALRWA